MKRYNSSCKKEYKKLRKKLNNKFKKPKGEYSVMGAIGSWVEQSGIKCKPSHIRVLCGITGGKTFYPYQKKDRKKILKYLKENKKWVDTSEMRKKILRKKQAKDSNRLMSMRIPDQKKWG